MYSEDRFIGLYSIWRPPQPMKSFNFFEGRYFWGPLNFGWLIFEIYSKYKL